ADYLVAPRSPRRDAAGAGRTSNEHEAARAARDLVHGGGQGEVVDRGQAEGDQAKGGADCSTLVVSVDTEARMPRDGVGEVQLPVRLQPLALVAGEDRVDDLARIGARELGIGVQRR